MLTFKLLKYKIHKKIIFYHTQLTTSKGKILDATDGNGWDMNRETLYSQFSIG